MLLDRRVIGPVINNRRTSGRYSRQSKKHVDGTALAFRSDASVVVRAVVAASQSVDTTAAPACSAAAAAAVALRQWRP